MSKKVTSKEVADQFAIAIELLLNWLEQTKVIRITISGEERPARKKNESSLLNATEVSERLAVSKAYAYRLLQTNKLHAIRIGRSLRIRKGDLDKAIEQMKQRKVSG